MGDKIAPESADLKKPFERPPHYEHAPGASEKIPRRCHDLFFLFLYVLFWVGMWVIAGLALRDGDVRRLQYGTDSIGNTCGLNNDQIEPKLDATSLTQLYYFIDPNAFYANDSMIYKICVNKCPETTGQVLCRYDVTPSADSVEFGQQVLAGNCTLSLATKPVFNRCVPSVFINALNSTGSTNQTASNSVISDDLNARSTSVKVFQDISNTYKWILVSCGVALVLSFAWLLFLQFFAGIMIWTSIWSCLATLGALSSFLLYNYYRVNRENLNEVGTGFARVDTALANQKLLLALGLIGAIAFLVILLLVVVLRKRIALAVNIIKEASKAMRSMPLIVVLPIIKYIAILALFAWVVFIWCLLSTAGTQIGLKTATSLNNATASYGFQTKVFTPNQALEGLQIYYLFGLLWTYSFILACGQIIIAGAIGSWYWTRDKKSLLPKGLILRSIYRLVRYHLGTAALGSLIMGTVRFVKFTILWAKHQAKKSKNKVAEYVFSCLSCLVYCCEKALDFLSKNAYIETAIYGYSFCGGAKVAFELLTRNAVRVAVLDRIEGFLIFMGRLTITAMTTIVGLALIQREAQEKISFYAIPVTLIIIFSWVITGIFFSLFDVAIDTIFLCFAEDSERHDGSADKPYYMSDRLRKFVDLQKPKI